MTFDNQYVGAAGWPATLGGIWIHYSTNSDLCPALNCTHVRLSQNQISGARVLILYIVLRSVWLKIYYCLSTVTLQVSTCNLLLLFVIGVVVVTCLPVCDFTILTKVSIWIVFIEYAVYQQQKLFSKHQWRAAPSPGFHIWTPFLPFSLCIF